MTTLNPLEAVISWLDAQPPDIEKEMAFLIMYFALPTIELETDADYWTEEFRKWIAPTSDRRLDVSKALTFRAYMEFLVRSRFSKDGWQETRERLDYLKSRAAEDRMEGVEEFTASTIAQIPFREAIWIRAGQGWDQLCEGPLSNKGLDQFLFSRGAFTTEL